MNDGVVLHCWWIHRDNININSNYLVEKEVVYQKDIEDEDLIRKDKISETNSIEKKTNKEKEVNSNELKPTLIYFQENAGNMGQRQPSMKIQHSALKMNLFLVSYRGYGSSTGIPNEEKILQDSKVLQKYVASKSSQVFILGRSLGGAVTIGVASDESVRHLLSGIILENTFTSIKDILLNMYPRLSSFLMYV